MVVTDVPAAYYTSQFRAKGGKPVRRQWDRLEWGDDIWNRAPGIYYIIYTYTLCHWIILFWFKFVIFFSMFAASQFISLGPVKTVS